MPYAQISFAICTHLYQSELLLFHYQPQMNQDNHFLLVQAWEGLQNQETPPLHPDSADRHPTPHGPSGKVRRRHRSCPNSHLPARILNDSPEGVIITQSLDYCEGKVLSDDLCTQILYNLGVCQPNPDDFRKLRAKLKRELYSRRKGDSNLPHRFLKDASLKENVDCRDRGLICCSNTGKSNNVHRAVQACTIMTEKFTQTDIPLPQTPSPTSTVLNPLLDAFDGSWLEQLDDASTISFSQ